MSDKPKTTIPSARDSATWPEPTVPMPPIEELMESEVDYGVVEATDGCMVEPDGICRHGHPSWLLRLGLI